MLILTGKNILKDMERINRCTRVYYYRREIVTVIEVAGFIIGVILTMKLYQGCDRISRYKDGRA